MKIYRAPMPNGHLYYCGDLQKVQDRYRYDHVLGSTEDLSEVSLHDVPKERHIYYCGIQYREIPIEVRRHNREVE